jgi:hypothetical protein
VASGRQSRMNRLRAQEDAALAAWRRASADLEMAAARRDAAIGRAQATMGRAMRPLAECGYQRLEQADADGDLVTVARYARRVGDVRRYLEAARIARGRLAHVRTAHDAKLESALRARSVAARALLALPPLPADVVGASRRQLGTYAAGRCQR